MTITRLSQPRDTINDFIVEEDKTAGIVSINVNNEYSWGDNNLMRTSLWFQSRSYIWCSIGNELFNKVINIRSFSTNTFLCYNPQSYWIQDLHMVTQFKINNF